MRSDQNRDVTADQQQRRSLSFNNWNFGNLRPSSARASIASLSSRSVNAVKWAEVAKESVVQLSKTAATKASELSSKVSEQAKDGTLMTNVQSGVTNLATNVGKFSTKTWADVQTYWSGKDSQTTSNPPERLNSESSQSDSVSLQVEQRRNLIFSFCLERMDVVPTGSVVERRTSFAGFSTREKCFESH